MEEDTAAVFELFDTIDSLKSELDEAIEVAFNHGATEWVRVNYPFLYKKLTNKE